MAPITREAEKSFFLAKAPLKLRATLTKGGAAFIGYRFPVYVEVTNTSKKKVESIAVMMNQVLKLLYQNNLQITTITAQGKASQLRNTIFEGSVQVNTQEGSGNISRELLVDILHEVPPSVTTGNLVS